MNVKKSVICIGICAAAAAVGLVLWLGTGTSPAPKAGEAAKRKAIPAASAKKVIPDATKPAAKAKRRPRPARAETAESEAGDSELSPKDQKLIDTIQDALDEEDFKSVKARVEDAAKSESAEVRQRAVDALQWFGPEAMPELTLFMADADEDVREGACSAWTMALSQVEDPQTKGDLVLAAMEIVRSRDALEMMVMEINDLAEPKQVEILKTLISGKNATAAAVAREHYEFVTGEPYGAGEKPKEGD